MQVASNASWIPTKNNIETWEIYHCILPSPTKSNIHSYHKPLKHIFNIQQDLWHLLQTSTNWVPNFFFPFHVYWAEISGSKAPDFISPNSRASACTLEWVLLTLLHHPPVRNSLLQHQLGDGGSPRWNWSKCNSNHRSPRSHNLLTLWKVNTLSPGQVQLQVAIFISRGSYLLRKYKDVRTDKKENKYLESICFLFIYI